MASYSLEEENAALRAKNAMHMKTINSLVAESQDIVDSANGDRERSASLRVARDDALRRLGTQERHVEELEQTLDELRTELHEATANNVRWMQAAKNRIEELQSQLGGEADTDDCAGKISVLEDELHSAADELALGQSKYKVVSEQLAESTETLEQWKQAAEDMEKQLHKSEHDVDDANERMLEANERTRRIKLRAKEERERVKEERKRIEDRVEATKSTELAMRRAYAFDRQFGRNPQHMGGWTDLTGFTPRVNTNSTK
jgi:chromosome segregation ATPase